MLVSSVLSLNGGAGKTTVTPVLASAAIHRGVETVLVDLDPQANATAAFDPDQASTDLDTAAAVAFAGSFALPRSSDPRPDQL